MSDLTLTAGPFTRAARQLTTRRGRWMRLLGTTSDHWSEFRGRPNDDDTLRDKAHAVSTLLVELARDEAPGLAAATGVDWCDVETVRDEALIILVHLVDRLARETTEDETAGRFVELVVTFVQSEAAGVRADDVGFAQRFVARSTEYRDLDLLPAEAIRSGVSRTVGYRLAEYLGFRGVEELTAGTRLSGLVSDLARSAADRLQLPSLLATS